MSDNHSPTAVKHPPRDVGNDWRRRWYVLPSWRVLHRVSSLEPEPGNEFDIAGVGVTVCGQRGRLCMPGIMSRMGLRRCAHCCRILGVPQGNGAPFNEGIDA